jgi:putative acetyltransferase
MINEVEIDDAVRIWMNYSKSGAGLMALYHGRPCGLFNLYIQPFKKIAHNCLFSIIVDEEMRGKGSRCHSYLSKVRSLQKRSLPSICSY